MEGGASSGTCYMMGFGETSSGLCPMTMMMSIPLPLVTSHHAGHVHHPHHPNLNLNNQNNEDMNSSFLLSPFSNNHDRNNQNGTTRTTFTLDYNHDDSSNNNHNGTTAGLVSSFMETNSKNNGCSSSSSVKAKIMAHPYYHRLLAAYASCQKVGAPPEVVARLEEVCASMSGQARTGCLGEDPALDQFMEAYCEMLVKYEQELSKPFKEAMHFLERMECQFKALTISSSDSACNEAMDNAGSSEDGVDVHNNLVDPQVEDRELKTQLLRKYSGYLGSLKQEFMKKRKKGKLPKEARQQLLDWWSRHYKWPYPSESQKLALAESTGLDQKQINNWFINQRKRHWKPSEDMQFVVMDAAHPHYYMDNVLGNPFPMDLSSALM